MRPDDVRWPAVREAARRILRTRKVVMDVNENDMDTAHRLVSAISDANPAQLTLPEVRAAHTTRIWNAEAECPLVAWDSSDDVRTLLFQSEGALSVIFHDVAAMALSLLEAGYPGCLGCGGPGLEDPWDEEAWRSRQVTTSFK